MKYLLQKITEKRYYTKDKDIFLVGNEINDEKRNLEKYIIENFHNKYL